MRSARWIPIALFSLLGGFSAWLWRSGPRPEPPPVPVESAPGARATSPALPPAAGAPPSAAPAGTEQAREIAPADPPGPRGAAAVDAPPPAGRLTVLVRSVEGEPLGSARVKVEAGLPDPGGELGPWPRFEAEATTGPQGTAEIGVPLEVPLVVEAEAEGFAWRRIGPVFAGDRVVVPLERFATLTGRVVDAENGAGVSGAVILLAAGGRLLEATADEQGSFALRDRVPPGSHEWLAVAPDRPPERGVIEVGAKEQGWLEIRLREGLSVEGRVLDAASGTGIPGAVVRASSSLRARRFADRVPIPETRTDDEGRFALAGLDPRGWLDVRAEGFSPARVGLSDRRYVRAEEEIRRIEVPLGPAVRLEGRVIDPDGRPVARAVVRVDRSFGPEGGKPEARTDVEGRFVFTDLLPGRRFGLEILPPRDSGLAPSRAGGFVLRDEDITGVEITVDPEAVVTIVVRDSLGEPVEGARVMLSGAEGVREGGEPRLAYCGSDGRARFGGLSAGVYTVEARRGEFVAPPEPVVAVAGREVEATLRLQEGAVVVGVVVDERGRPIEAARVTARRFDEGTVEALGALREAAAGEPRPLGRRAGREGRGGGRRDRRDRRRWGALARVRRFLFEGRAVVRSPERFLREVRATALADAQGRFALKGLAPGERLLVEARGEGLWPAVREATAGGPSLRLQLSPLWTLRGEVFDARSGLPLSGFAVAVRPKEEAPAAGISPERLENLLLPLAQRGRRFKNSDGHFEVEGLAPVAHEIRVTARGYRPTDWVLLPYPQSVSVPVRVALAPAAEVNGRVLSTSGDAIVGLRVTLLREPGEEEAAAKRVRTRVHRTAGDGRFYFLDPEPGRYRLVLGPARSPLVEPVVFRLSEGEKWKRTFRIEGAGEVRVEVRGLGSGPVGRARVRLRGKRTGIVVAGLTRQDGEVRFRGLLPDEYDIEARARGFERSRSSCVLSPAGRVDAVLTLAAKP